MHAAAEAPDSSRAVVRRPERALLAFVIWVAAGTACAITYRTDAAPDYVIRREALTAALFAPLHLADGVACNFSGQSAIRAAGWGSLALFIALTGIMLTRRSIRGIFLSAVVLASVLAASVFLLLRSYPISVG